MPTTDTVVVDRIDWVAGSLRARLVITQHDPVTGIVVDSVFEVVAATPAVRTRTVVGMDAGFSPITLWLVSSFATGAAVSDRPDVDVWCARSGWCAENRWERTPLRSDGLLAIDPLAHGETCEARIAATSLSTWSSATSNPIGAATTRSTGVTLAWQVEHNGGWHWEVGEHPEGRGIVPVADRMLSPEPAGRQIGDRSFDGAYVLVIGPNDSHHVWSLTLRPGQSFESVPVTFTVGQGAEIAVPLPNLGSAGWIETLYPPPGTGVDWAVELQADGVRLTVPVGVASARMFRIRHADVGPADVE